MVVLMTEIWSLSISESPKCCGFMALDDCKISKISVRIIYPASYKVPACLLFRPLETLDLILTAQ